MKEISGLCAARKEGCMPDANLTDGAAAERALFVGVCYARLVHVFWAARVRF
jgi:hypothetical protein